MAGIEGKQSKGTCSMEEKRAFCEKNHDRAAITKEEKNELSYA